MHYQSELELGHSLAQQLWSSQEQSVRSDVWPQTIQQPCFRMFNHWGRKGHGSKLL